MKQPSRRKIPALIIVVLFLVAAGRPSEGHPSPRDVGTPPGAEKLLEIPPPEILFSPEKMEKLRRDRLRQESQAAVRGRTAALM